jgi:hypothetical protein
MPASIKQNTDRQGSHYSDGTFSLVSTYRYRSENWRQGELFCFTHKALNQDVIVQGDAVKPFLAEWNELEAAHSDMRPDDILGQLWTLHKGSAIPSLKAWEIGNLVYHGEPQFKESTS